MVSQLRWHSLRAEPVPCAGTAEAPPALGTALGASGQERHWGGWSVSKEGAGALGEAEGAGRCWDLHSANKGWDKMKWPQVVPREVQIWSWEKFLDQGSCMQPCISCPGLWWSPHPWRDLKAMCMWHLGTWISGDLGSAGAVVGLHYLGNLFQLKWFCDFKFSFHLPQFAGLTAKTIFKRIENKPGHKGGVWLFWWLTWCLGKSCVKTSAEIRCVSEHKC